MIKESEIYIKIKTNWDKIAKPLDSMGEFEHIISQIGAINGTVHPKLDKCAIVVFAADNGVVEEGISQSGQEVTAICTKNIIEMNTSVCVMAAYNNIDVIPVDMGVNDPLDVEHERTLIRKKISMGTKNFAKEPAMSLEQVQLAIDTGKGIAKQMKEQGYDIISVGEIGIGNTTTSSAVAAALLKTEAKHVTGRGAGLTDEGLLRKISVIDNAIKRYDLYNASPLEVLRCVGGYDIAGMVGMYIGGMEYSIPVVMDGMISMVAALVADKLKEGVTEYMIPSHISREPVALHIVKELKLHPVIDANMALGEGTGAAIMIGMLKTALEVYDKCYHFDSTDIEQYERKIYNGVLNIWRKR